MGLPHLFKPLRLRHKTLKNRVVFGAHTTNMAQDGLPGAAHLAYYRERAIGGAAMIVVEPMPVHAAAVLTRGNFRPSSDTVIEPFAALVDACHGHDTVMIQQLYHVGAHGDGDNSFHAAWSPSGGPSYHDSDGSHAMSVAEIEETIAGFVDAAKRCQASGFDGVEVWAAYNSLLDQFWAPFSNQRDDDWGGSLKNRTRLSRRILSQIRAACGEEFIIGLSVSDDQVAGALPDRAEIADILALHDAENLMDYVTCGTGSYLDFSALIPTFQYPEKLGTPLSEVLKDRLKSAAIIAESHIRTPENANVILGAGAADIVSIVRGQIADPHLVNKAKSGNITDIRGCLSCNQMCWGRRSRDYWISCLINPSVGREWQWGGEIVAPSTQPKSVLVVGAGPAGLEAARVAAERGHSVTLAEASPDLGGQFRLAGMQPRRAQITDLIDWYARQLENLGVEMLFNTYLDADDIIAFSADELILATGSQPTGTGFQKALPNHVQLPGIEKGNVWSAEDVMRRDARLGAQVLVLDEGGNWKGCGTAWALAEAGHEVTVITPDPLIGKELMRTSADFGLRRTLAGLGVRFVTESVIENWGADGAMVRNLLSDQMQFIAGNALVFATANRADETIANELAALGHKALVIGDACAARNAAFAIYDGRKTALNLGERSDHADALQM